jgi:Domain of unknown function (DUF1995)
MVHFPTTLDEAIAQAQGATVAAIAAGYSRLQVDLQLPELKPLEPAQLFLPAFADYGSGLKIFFTDAGAAALARRAWADLLHPILPHQIKSIDVAGARQTSTVDELIDPDDQAFLFIAPSSVEVLVVEQVCKAAGDRPVIMFNPRLEDVGTVGIGYAARQLRERFLNTVEPCYYLRPLDQAALLRCYPAPWQVWLENPTGYSLVGEELLRPNSERLDEILMQAMGNNPPKRSLMAQMQQFLRALGQ